MAWYPGTHSCGHEGRVQVYGPVKDRQRRADWIFSQPCPECKKANLRAEREEAAKVAAAKSQELELPQLIGTDKQVAWALQLRQKFMDKSTERINRIAEEYRQESTLSRDETEQEIEKTSAQLMQLVEHIVKSRTSASWWIDHRGYDNNYYLGIAWREIHQTTPPWEA